MATRPLRTSTPTPRPRLGVEPLESRELMASAITAILLPDGTLRVVGTEGPDVIQVSHVGGQVRVKGVRIDTPDGPVAGVPAEAVSRVVVDAGGGNDQVNLQGLSGRGSTVDTDVWGGEGNDTLLGGAGKDHLEGQGGNDYLRGRGGDDVLSSGAGNDRLYGDAGADVVRGGEGVDRAWGGAGNDMLSGDADKDFLAGGAGDDTIDGGAGSDELWGQDGNDLLRGRDGDPFLEFDFLMGGRGDDTLEGGCDYMWGGGGADHFDKDRGPFWRPAPWLEGGYGYMIPAIYVGKVKAPFTGSLEVEGNVVGDVKDFSPGQGDT